MRVLVLALSALMSSGCVVTTYEGPGDPPRVLTPPPPVSAGPSTPIEEPEPAEPKSAEPDAKPQKNAAEADTIQASHVLIAYRGSMRAQPSVTRSKQDALARAKQAHARAKSGENFAALAAEFSDEPGAAERKGSIGRFGRRAVVKEFADAAFALEPGQLSDVVETPFGYHIILRTE